MIFNSLSFALFLPMVFLIYWFVIPRLKWQNLFLLGASYVFYGWWDWRFLSLLLFSSVVDFLLGLQMERTEDTTLRKRYLGISLCVNLGLLGFFKYYGFFVDEFIAACHSLGFNFHMQTLHIILPVGISFYTFQTLSYTIDVYRKKIKAVDDWVVFFAYVSFFPQLVAGPIERAVHLIPQFEQPRFFDYLKARDGMQQILWGLFKKIVIADNCAAVVDYTFGHYAGLDICTLLLGVFLFAIQIYCDFSGYSDIAIGVARLFGFSLMRNFAFPYFSRDIAEFWRRWHISLSTWFRDYLYIPLGGSRVKSRGRLVFNVFAIFLVSGFWHGANWTFIIWGLLHGLYFLPQILLGNNRKYLDTVAVGNYLPGIADLGRMVLTFSLVCFAWIFFRSESISHALNYIWQMGSDLHFSVRPFRKHIVLLCWIVSFVALEWLHRGREHALQLDVHQWHASVRTLLYVSIAIAILLFFPARPSTFIYFQF